VDEHGAWISSTMELTPDGRYSFTFNYDQERAWPDGLPITREALEEDLQQHPRPWAEIPDCIRSSRATPRNPGPESHGPADRWPGACAQPRWRCRKVHGSACQTDHWAGVEAPP
jgi:hypothetical protein